MNVETVLVSAAVGIVTSLVTAYITTKFRMREERAKWEREFILKYAEARTTDRASAESLAAQFAIGFLVVEEPGKERKKVFIPSGARVIAGRQTGNEIELSDPTVSQKTVMFETEGSSVFVVNLGTQSRLLLNGARVESRAELKSGDIVAVGHTKITFQRL